MNRKEAAELFPIIKAYAEGRRIRCLSDKWENVDELNINYLLNHPESYRIESEPKYRPFENVEECWKEMEKHHPFGWIKRNGYFYNIISTGVVSMKIIDTKGAITTLGFNNLLSHYSFADGTPFGIKEEE